MTTAVNANTFSIVIFTLLVTPFLSYRLGAFDEDKFTNIKITDAPTFEDVVMGDYKATGGEMDPNKCTLARKEINSHQTLLLTCFLETDVEVTADYVDEPNKTDPIMSATAGTPVIYSIDVRDWSEDDFEGFTNEKPILTMREVVETDNYNLILELSNKMETYVQASNPSVGEFYVLFPYLDSARLLRNRRLVLV